jgi:ribonuclease PH
MTADDQLVEVQATGEAHPFSRSTLNQMLDLASAGCGEIFQLQQQAVRDAQ